MLRLVGSIRRRTLDPVRRRARPRRSRRRARGLGDAEQARRRASALAARDRLGEQELGREAVGEPGGRPGDGSAWAACAAAAIPSGPVEGAGEVDRELARRSAFASPMPPTLASFTVARSQAPSARRALGVLDALDASRRRRSGSIGRRVTSAISARSATGCSASSIPSGSIMPQHAERPRRRPGAVRVDADPRVRARARSRTARTSATSSPAPSLSLKVSNPRRPSARPSAATPSGSPATSVALQRTGVGRLGAEQRQSGPPRALPARSKSAISIAAAAGAGSRGRRRRGCTRRPRRAVGSSPATSARSARRRRRRARAGRARRASQRRRAATAARPRRAPRGPRRCEPDAGPSRALERCPAPSRRARETAASTGRPRPRTHRPCSVRQAAISSPSETEQAEDAEQGAGPGQGAVERRAVGARRAPPAAA